jgi:iron(II)-dependent oxidoreductase
VVKDCLVRQLKDASGRSRWLLRGVSDENLEAQHHQIMSPLIYDYGHIGDYEELWL